MKKGLVSALGAALAAAVTFTPRPAHALGPVGVEVAAKGGYGTSPDSSYAFNPYGVGLGARGGVSFLGLYGGLNVVYYLGGSTKTALGEVKAHTLLYGLEAGYGISLLDILTIRPQIGLGNATASASGLGQDVSNSNIYLEPGVTGLVSLGGFFVGADANLLVLPGADNGTDGAGNKQTKTFTSFTAHGQVGVKF